MKPSNGLFHLVAFLAFLGITRDVTASSQELSTMVDPMLSIDVYDPLAVFAQSNLEPDQNAYFSPGQWGTWNVGLSPHQAALLIQGVKEIAWTYDLVRGYRSDTWSFAKQEQADIDWDNLSRRSMTVYGDRWPEGNWELNANYNAAELRDWFLLQMTHDSFAPQLTEQQLARDLRAGAMHATAWDPWFAAVCTEAELRVMPISSNNKRDVQSAVHAMWRLLWNLSVLGRQDLVEELLADPAGYRFNKTIRSWPEDLPTRAPVDGPSRAALKSLLALEGSGKLRAQSGLGGELAEAQGSFNQEVRAFTAFWQEMQQPVTERWAALDETGFAELLPRLLQIFGRENDLCGDLILYWVENRETVPYVIRPQDWLYIAVHVARSYAKRDHSGASTGLRSPRSWPLFMALQQYAMESTQTKEALSHDLFNAMEASTYLVRALYPSHKQSPLVEAVQKMAEYSVKIAWHRNGRSKKDVRWEHRWLALNILTWSYSYVDKYNISRLERWLHWGARDLINEGIDPNATWAFYNVACEHYGKLLALQHRWAELKDFFYSVDLVTRTTFHEYQLVIWASLAGEPRKDLDLLRFCYKVQDEYLDRLRNIAPDKVPTKTPLHALFGDTVPKWASESGFSKKPTINP